MITTLGALQIKRYMAGFEASIAKSLAYGIGSSATVAASTKLQFEVGRVDISLTSLDLVNNKLIFKAELDASVNASIYEFGLYSVSSDVVAGPFGSSLISTFDSDSENWTTDGTTPSTFSSATARIGGDSLHHAPAASASQTDILNDILLDLSGYSGNDKFVLAMNVANANTSAVKIRLLTDANNYYDIAYGAQSAGYNIVEALKSSATATGTPSWSTINQIQVITTSSSNGASSIDYDGFRIDDADTVNPEYVMVSRQIPAAPVVKLDGQVNEVEYAMNVNIS